MSTPWLCCVYRLAAYICGYTTVTIVISGNYSLSNFREDLQTMYKRAGLKGEGLMFLITDSQVKSRHGGILPIWLVRCNWLAVVQVPTRESCRQDKPGSRTRPLNCVHCLSRSLLMSECWCTSMTCWPAERFLTSLPR